jgi:predicted RND superfamily exporter protein
MNEQSESLLRRFSRIGANRPFSSLAFLLAVSLVAILGLLRVTVDTGSEQMMQRDGSERQVYLHVAREFGSDIRSFIYLKDELLWSPEKLGLLKQLHDELRKLPFVERIDDLFTRQTVLRIDGQLEAQPLLIAVPSDAPGAERARAVVVADPLATHYIVSGNGSGLAIGISVRESFEGAGGMDVNGALERALAPVRAQFSTLVQVGPPRIEAEFRQSLVRDLRVLVPASALILAVFMFVLYRSALAAAMPLVVGAMGLLWTFGMMGLAGIPVSILSAIIPSLAAVASATGIIRMISGYYRGLQHDPDQDPAQDRIVATESMVRSLGAPTVLTVLITALGFAGNGFSGIAFSRDFGLSAAFAIFSNGLITVLLVPALYSALGPRRPRSPGLALSDWLSVRVARLIGMLRHRLVPWGLALGAALCVVLVQQSSGLYATNEPLAFFRPDSALVQATVRMHEELAGVRTFYITLDASAEGAFRDPANLQRLAEIQAFIEKQEIFDRSLSLADIVSQANQAAAGGRADAYRVPSTRKLVGQYLLMYPPRDLEPYVSHDFRRANIVVRHSIRDSSSLNRHVRELRQAVAHYAGSNMATSVVGENLLINAAADRLLLSQGAVFAALLVAVFICVSLMFTSVKGGIIALVPSVVPVLMILGVMRVLEIPLNAGTLLVAVVAIGIAVEGTIHLFLRYNELCGKVSDYEDAVIETLKIEAVPMIAISFALALCFGPLLFSDFTLISQFGALAATAIVFSIVTNLLITPLVLSRIRLVGLYEILTMSMSREALDGSPLFHGMSGYQIRKTILISELRSYGEGERLIEQGTVGRSMYLLVSGQLEVVRHEGTSEWRVALFGPGDVFGEIGFVHETYRTADVRALGDVSVLRFDHDRLRRDLVFFPSIMAKLIFNISGILGKRLAEVVEKQHSPASPTEG